MKISSLIFSEFFLDFLRTEPLLVFLAGTMFGILISALTLALSH